MSLETTADKFIEAAMKPEAGFTWDKAGNIMSRGENALSSAERVLGFVERVIQDADRSRTVAAAIKIMGARFGVDLNTPLPPTGNDGIYPASDTHAQILTAMNGLAPDQAAEAMGVLQQWYANKAKGSNGTGTDRPAAGTPPAP